jgi:hypothetical protein
MQELILYFDQHDDQRVVFLRCYMMMTENMTLALTHNEFRDPPWVDVLLARFAEYYFDALDAYNANPASAPAVWSQAHEASHGSALPLQKLLLGVNAHINYDLVLTVVDLLQPEWMQLSPQQRTDRYDDFCYVNTVIARTIDAVQDTVIGPMMPAMRIVDALLGRMDEELISRMVTRWRDEVWTYAVQMLETEAPDVRAQLTQQVEQAALRRASAIALTDWRAVLDELT